MLSFLFMRRMVVWMSMLLAGVSGVVFLVIFFLVSFFLGCVFRCFVCFVCYVGEGGGRWVWGFFIY